MWEFILLNVDSTLAFTIDPFDRLATIFHVHKVSTSYEQPHHTIETHNGRLSHVEEYLFSYRSRSLFPCLLHARIVYEPYYHINMLLKMMGLLVWRLVGKRGGSGHSDGYCQLPFLVCQLQIHSWITITYRLSLVKVPVYQHKAIHAPFQLYHCLNLTPSKPLVSAMMDCLIVSDRCANKRDDL